MNVQAQTWLLLVTNLPGHNPNLRMRTWRALKAAGVGLLRDGAYLLPRSESARTVLEAQGAEIKAAGGAAHLLSFASSGDVQEGEFTALFDRTEEYAEALQRVSKLKAGIAKLAEPGARQQLANLEREVAAIAARDFFAGEAHKQAMEALNAAQVAINDRFAPDEPHPAHHKIRARVLKDYRSRTWATREHLWVDRLASAWLIRRFIDPKAKFVWLKRPKDCPKRAIGFDFDGAEFSHVESLVTFEVLIASFALAGDAGLSQLGALVHHLDVGGIPVAEGPGFATILAGARTLQVDDDALLLTMTPVLDSLYAAFSMADPKE